MLQIIYTDTGAEAIDPREKERLLEETLDQYKQWPGVIARNNASEGSWRDLEQEIRIAFYGASSGPGTWFRARANNTVQDFRSKGRNSKKSYARALFLFGPNRLDNRLGDLL